MQPITLKTFNGYAINSASYKATLLNASQLPSAANVWIEETDADQRDAQTFTRGLRNPLVQIQILDYSNRHALGEQLKRWFKPGTRGALVATFADDGLDYQLNCAAINIVQDVGDALTYTGQLESGDTAWRAVVADTATWHVTGTGGTKVINVQGSDETRLCLSLVSTTGGVIGYTYQNIYKLQSVPGINYGTRPWCISLNSATLVTAGKLQADMDDYRVLVNGAEVPRWIANPNTATTKVWFNAPIGRGESLPLLTPIAATGNISAIQFAKTTANRAALTRMPASGMLYHGTEWFSYTAKDPTNYKVTGIRRGIYGTTKQAHIADDAFVLIPATIVVRYGNAAVKDPSLNNPYYDVQKPLFDLSASDNTKWVYTASTLFYDKSHPQAPGRWSPVLQTAATIPTSETYLITGDGESGAPALGAKLGCFLKNGIWTTESGKAGWTLMCPGGFSKITLTGRKYAVKLARWVEAGCWRSDDGTTYYNVFTDAAPTVAATWQSLASHSAVAVATTSKYLFVGLQGTMAALANALNIWEALTVTPEFYSTNLPSGTFLGETGNFSLDETIGNDTTSEQIALNYPMVLNTAFVVDGENYLVTYDDVNMSDALQLDDNGRAVWIRLLPGNNTLRLTADDAGTQDITLSWYRRRL